MHSGSFGRDRCIEQGIDFCRIRDSEFSVGSFQDHSVFEFDGDTPPDGDDLSPQVAVHQNDGLSYLELLHATKIRLVARFSKRNAVSLPKTKMMIRFDTDYLAGAHPEVLQRLVDTNSERTAGYGSDPYTQRAAALIREACGAPDARVYFMVGGTQTNTTVIDGLLAHHEGVMAAESGHINVHETGAIEATGHKVLVLPTQEGKVKAADVAAYIDSFYADDTYEHMVAPGMLYISLPTEYGTMYRLSELEELSAVCRRHEIPLYVDGARLGFGLAAARGEITLSDVARLCDVFYIGGTKMGTLFGEAVVVTNPKLLKHFVPLMKQHGGLLAKGRLLGLQFEALFQNQLFERIGEKAVRLALRIREAFCEKGYPVVVDSPTNQQFFRLPNTLIDRLSPHVGFELWGPRGTEESLVRFVTGWHTTDEDVDQLITYLKPDR